MIQQKLTKAHILKSNSSQVILKWMKDWMNEWMKAAKIDEKTHSKQNKKSEVKVTLYLRVFRAHSTLSCRENWCPQIEGLTFYHVFTVCFSRLVCLQGFVQPAEIRHLMDFGLEAGSLVQESQFFFPGALSSAQFRAARHGGTLVSHCCHCWIAKKWWRSWSNVTALFHLCLFFFTIQASKTYKDDLMKKIYYSS